MSVVRTAISLQENLFEQMTEISTELSLSRSKLIATALQEYIERYKNKRLLDRLNSFYEEYDQEEELAISHAYTRSLNFTEKFTEENEW